MEQASRRARQAADLEARQEWEAAAAAHAEAAELYRSIDTLSFDPVAVLTLTSLANRHVRWAESCRRETKREGLAYPNPRASVAPASSGDGDAGDAGPGGAQPGTPGGRAKGDGPEFEDFWQYMQNWLANPAAFTRPTVTPSSHGMDVLSSAHGVMESFYLVGPDPEQSAIIQTTASTTQRPSSPRGQPDGAGQTEPEAAVGTPEHNQAPLAPADGASAAVADRVQSTLAAENRRLVRLAQTLSERVRTLESAAHENSMLKSSIFNFREEFQRHANAVTLPAIREAEAETAAAASTAEERIRFLEEELQKAQQESAKQKAQVAKYRDRWERLKESAKRKRQQQELAAHEHRQGPAA
ncbi:hypothetical protein IWQ57_003694 [Coemansia nantahalensis]|uniref:Uncharacterized protein n=1 Tax=Coemansia nantahalensis TaxID=2789366 RepID=A0ACC1JV30_9FUNG|nr:hypothetical protein IWQ57_003694 [Coemansia nantahalensis]